MPAVFRHDLIVGPASIDALAHANNREFLRWMEEAAVRHSDARGWTTARYLHSGGSWVASSHRIDYLRPAFEGDALIVWTWIAAIAPRTCLRRHAVLRACDTKALAIGETRWAFVDLASGRAIDVPKIVAGAYEVVAADDPRLDALGPARRLLQRYD